MDELDQLKKSWNLLNEEIQDKEFVTNEQLQEIINSCKKQAQRSVNRLNKFQMVSLGIGFVASLSFIILCVVLPQMEMSNTGRIKAIVAIPFFALTLVGGMYWDLKTYRFLLSMKVDELPVLDIIRKIQIFRKWAQREVMAIIIWIFLFMGLYYWLGDVYQQSLVGQIVFFAFSFVLDAFMLYFIYKKLVFNPIHDIKQNMDELNRLAQE